MGPAAGSRPTRLGALRDTVGSLVGAVPGLVPMSCTTWASSRGAVLTGAGGNAALYSTD